MENKECRCEDCEHFNDCEIGILLHNPTTTMDAQDVCCGGVVPAPKRIKKGEKIAQIKLVEHKSYLMGYESEVERDGGFGSTDRNDGQNNEMDLVDNSGEVHISSMLDDEVESSRSKWNKA